MCNEVVEEVRSRLAAGWSNFDALKNLLLDRKISVKRRPTLFDATLGSTALWFTEYPALRVEDKLTLKGGLNSMLRKVVNISRAKGEVYV